MTISRQYGFTFDSEVPTIGVLNSSEPEFMHEDMYNGSGIDIDFESHEKECDHEYHDDCYTNDEPTYVIGMRKDKDGLYEPDPDAEYSAIVSQQYTQVLRSKWVSRAHWCSPCFPGQCDLDTAGDYLAFTLPKEVWGNAEHLEIMEYKS